MNSPNLLLSDRILNEAPKNVYLGRTIYCMYLSIYFQDFVTVAKENEMKLHGLLSIDLHKAKR